MVEHGVLESLYGVDLCVRAGVRARAVVRARLIRLIDCDAVAWLLAGGLKRGEPCS